MIGKPQSSSTSEGTVLLFGPQVLSFDHEAFEKLHLAISTGPAYHWITKTIAELPECWSTLSQKIAELGSVDGEKLLNDLKTCFETGVYTDVESHLPNILLTPLVFVGQLAQYTRYLDIRFSKSPDQDDLQASLTHHNTSTVGFCTGLLSALAVSSASTRAEFERYGAVAIRLAMLIGALVDSQEAPAGLHGHAKSYAVAWNTPDQGKDMTRMIDRFPEAYVSVLYDEKRATVTTAERTAPLLLQHLKAAGIKASEVGLRDRFHSHCHDDIIDSVIQLCDDEENFQFPRESQLALPLLNFGLGTDGNMQSFALKAILVEQSKWYQTFAYVQSTHLRDTSSVVVSIGPDRCVPPSLMRKIGPYLIHMADLDQEMPKLSTSVLDPEDYSRYAVNSDNDDIAVIGMSIKVAGADDLVEFSEIIREGKSQHIEVPESRFGFETQWREIDTKRKWYGNFIRDVDAFDHKFFKKSPREAASQDPQQRLMLQAAYQAVEQSGYFASPNAEKHVGCYIGTCAGDYESNAACHPANAFTSTGTLKSFIAGKVSHYFGWTGPGMTIDTACSASAVAIHLACRAILSGECNGALAGGVATMENPLLFQNLAGASFLSPTGQCKPFDDGADGYCRGEGIACVFLKKMSAAIADGNQIFGCIASTAVHQNENCTPLFVPNSPSLAPLFSEVVRRAGLEPKHISFVEAHGTGTSVGDPAEYESIRLALGGTTRSKPLPIGSVKGLVGHTEGTSGVVSLIKVLLMMREGFIPSQASFSKMAKNIKSSPSDMLVVPTQLERWQDECKAALINNYGASGSNASLVVTQPIYGNNESSILQSLAVKQPFWIAGYDERSVVDYCKRLAYFIKSKAASSPGMSLADLSFNVARQSNRSLSRGSVFSCSSIMELEEKVTSIASNGSHGSPAPVKTSRPVILCFGGQVSRFVGLDQAIYRSIKLLRSYLDQCDSIFKSIGLDGIYPDIFQRTPVADTVKLQTMLFAIQYSCAKCWIDSGIEVAAVVGHSFGELTALCVSGALSLIDTVRLIAGRARVIRDLWGDDPGSMMAIEGDLELVERLITDSNNHYHGDRPASIACYNGPRSFTIAGSVEIVEAVAQTCSANYTAIKMKKLSVTNAFHSTLVEPLMSCLEEEVGRVLTFKRPLISFERATESMFTGELSARYVAEHMRFPVYFDHAVQRLAKEHPSSIWLEAGSCSTVTVMANRALGSLPNAHFQAINITSDNATQSLVDSTISLWKEGLRVSFWAHHALQTDEFAPLMLPPYQFEKSRHWLELKKPQQAIIQTSQPPMQPDVPQGLWTFVGYKDDAKRTARFRVNTTTKAYNDFVSGHLIANTAPICPATLQIDMAIEALLSLLPEATAAGFMPQVLNLQNHVPVCINPSNFVWLEYEAQDGEKHEWSWRMISNGPDEKKGTTVHVDGKIFLRSPDDTRYQLEFGRYERLVQHQRCLDVLNNDQIADDILQGSRIYKTFAEVVDYGESYRGVKKIVGRGNISVGRVHQKYTGETWFDTLLSDCFSQVGGVWVNCMTDQAAADMFIASGCEVLMRSPRVVSNYQRPETWDVYAAHHKKSDKLYLTDLFVFDPTNGLLMEVMLGINYAKVPKASMSRMLSRLTAPDALPSMPSVAAGTDILQPINVPVGHAQSSVKDATSAKPKKEKKPASRPDISDNVRGIVASVSGLEPDEIKPDSELADFGIDSLMGMELAREAESFFKCTFDQMELMEATTFQKFVKCIEKAVYPEGANDGSIEDDNRSEAGESDTSSADSESVGTPASSTGTSPNESFVESKEMSTGEIGPQISQSDLLEAFGQVKMKSDQYIVDYKIENFIDTIMAKSNQLCIALVVEAFEAMGCSLKSAVAGQEIKRVNYEPHHERLVGYLYDLLEKEARLIDVDGTHITRTAISIPTKPSETLQQDLIRSYPEWIYAHKLAYFSGKHLADVLAGKTDGIRVIFGSAEARELVSGLYCELSVNKMAYNIVKDFMNRLIPHLDFSKGPLKILEMGAGTGGTTLVLAPFLQSLNIPVEYTYTDLSSSMIAQAKRKFKAYPFMKFAVHDIEASPAEDLLGQHIVIASNAVHATHSLTKSASNIRKTLRPDGFLVMVEMTETVPYVDIIFGLLEGWWLFDDGRRHATASPSRWETDLQSVGFGHVDWTDGVRPENQIQKVIIALASGPAQARLPKPQKQLQRPVIKDLATREADVARYVEHYSRGFVAPVANGRNIAVPHVDEQCVLVTGTTGSLGSHLVASLAEQPHVKHVMCINRRSSIDVKTRQEQALTSRGIKLDAAALAKLKIFETDTSKSHLGLPESEYDWLVQNVTHILHNAWPMSGTRPIKTFEPQFHTLRNLLDLSHDIVCLRDQSQGFKVGFELISSIGVVGHYPLWSGKTYVPEERMEMRSALPIGYCEAKLTCERILDATLHRYPQHFRTMTARPGQIAGSRTSGYWNPVEHLSFLFKSSQSLKALPAFEGTLQWVPVNDVASTCVDLLLAEGAPHPIYHIDNPVGQPWKEMISVLAEEMDIPEANIIPFDEWIKRVRRSPMNMDTDNPAARLLGFLDDNFERMSCGGLILDTGKTKEHSSTLREQGPVGMEVARGYVRKWKEMGFLAHTMEPVYEPLQRKRESDISYQPVAADFSPNPEKPGGYHILSDSQSRQHARRRVFFHYLWLILSFLWLAPIAALLYLNFSHYVIGASVWCPGGKCNSESTTDGAIARAHQLDRHDHDALGALQFVAKFLEVWFAFVATGLVYDIGILFAKKGRGLPVGYLLTHLEFADLRYIFNPLLWTSPWPHRHSVPEKRARIIKLYIFAVLTALLTILANLMGPATAVLVLPTMQWIDTPHVMNSTFNGTSVMYQPSGEDVFIGCNASQLFARNYSCTSYMYGASLDAQAAQGIASTDQAAKRDGIGMIGVSQEVALQFTYNSSQGQLTWIANRQVLREMSHEYLKTQGLFAQGEHPEYPDARFNNSLQTILQRQGPSLGVQSNCYAGTKTDFHLDDNEDTKRWVRCYTGWRTWDGTASYTKCLRLGKGFNSTSYDAQVHLAVEDINVPENEIAVGVYFADKATYYSDTDDFNSGIKACVANNETSMACDWDRVFDSAQLPVELKNTSVNVGVVSYGVPGAEDEDNRVWCDHVTYQSFPTYSVDTRIQSNPESLVTLNDLPGNATFPQVVNPDWWLAAWSVDEGDSLDGERQIVKKLIDVLPAAWDYFGAHTWDSDLDSETFYLIHTYSLGQSLSLVPYTSTPALNSTSTVDKEADKDKNVRPILRTWATVHVWAYSISGRTSRLGVVVVMVGSLCVIARFVMGLATGITERSTVEVLAAAFEHRHQGEFEGLQEETHLAQVRYQIVEDGEGKQRFIPEKRTSRWSNALHG
ncbi:MAG: hypothetical protein Q9170_007158 [Blastenia crenularia]